MHQAIYSAQFSSVQPLSRAWLCDPMDRSTAGFPVHHQLPELAQTHVHRVGDAIQPSHPLSSPSPPAFNHVSKTIKLDSCNDNKYEYFLTINKQNYQVSMTVIVFNYLKRKKKAISLTWRIISKDFTILRKLLMDWKSQNLSFEKYTSEQWFLNSYIPQNPFIGKTDFWEPPRTFLNQ